MTRDFGKAKTHRRHVLWQGSIGSFGLEDLELPDGRRFELALLEHPGAAAIVPFLDADTIVMLRQYRHAAGGTIWEVPAGKLDRGEAAETCAARELEEETGYRARRIERLGSIHTSPGFTDEVIHLFAGHDLDRGQRSLDPHETLETETVAFERALKMTVSGEITDSKTMCALFLAERRRRG